MKAIMDLRYISVYEYKNYHCNGLSMLSTFTPYALIRHVHKLPANVVEATLEPFITVSLRLSTRVVAAVMLVTAAGDG